MLRRVLILFGNELNTKKLLEAGEYLKNRYSCEVKGLYVKDVRKHEIIPPSVEGLIVDTSSKYLVEEWDRFENEQIEKLKEKLDICCTTNDLIVREGITPDTALEELKSYDLLLVGKGERISGDLKYLLKYHYKPLLIISDEDLDLSKVLVSNDKGFKVNKSFFRFLSLFDDVKKFTSISVNLEPEDDYSLGEYLKATEKEIEYVESEGDSYDIIEAISKENTFLIMGDMTHSYLVEKITGHVGVKIIENLKIPIFIA